MQWIINRLKEPSTWRGLVVLAMLAGLKLSPEQADAIVTAGAAVVGALGVLTADRVQPATTGGAVQPATDAGTGNAGNGGAAPGPLWPSADN